MISYGKTLIEECLAKVNLALDVISRRDDGYHNVNMIMQEIGIKDILTVSAEKGNGVSISCSDSRIPCDESNLAAKAARIFAEAHGESARIYIHIEKNIPSGAGLGGGSSDAAGVLRALNRIFGSPFDEGELMKMGAKIGADVPFFICGGTMTALGTGTELKAEQPPKKGVMVVAKPEFEVGTAHVYKSLVLDGSIKHPDIRAVLGAVRRGEYRKLSEIGGNVLETVTAAEHSEIGEYKSVMYELGAEYSLMSGSGPSVFGIFKAFADAESAAAELRKRTREVFVTEFGG